MHLVLVNLDFPCSQWGEAVAPQGDPPYPKISTKDAVSGTYFSLLAIAGS